MTGSASEHLSQFPERFTTGLVSQEETDRRLGSDLCVWCAREMTPHMGDGMFCQQTCHILWQRATFAKATGTTPTDEDDHMDTSAQVGGRRVSPDDTMDNPGPAPGWMGGLTHRGRGVTEIPNPPAFPGFGDHGHHPDRHSYHNPDRAYFPPPFNSPRGENLRLETDDGFALIAGEPIPVGFDYVLWGPGQYSIAGTMPRDGILVTEPHTTGVTDPGHFAVGPQQVRQAGRIVVLTPEPEPELKFPIMSLRHLLAGGWKIGCAVQNAPPTWRPERTMTIECPRCGEFAEPIIVTKRWPGGEPRRSEIAAGESRGQVQYNMADPGYLWTAPLPESTEIIDGATPEDAGGVQLIMDLVPGSKVVCSRCALPYPGPQSGAVPIWHPHLEGLSMVGLGMLHPTGRFTVYRISTEALHSGLPEAIVGDAWRSTYQRGLEEGTQWRCGVPGCGEGPARWVSLAAQLHWLGHQWGPLDQDPVRVGLCHQHYMGLYHQCLIHDQHSFVPMDLTQGWKQRTTLIH